MLKLDIVFSGLGITKRNNTYISRSINSFNNIKDNIIGLPILLDHPTNIDTNYKDLLNINTEFSIIGNIEDIIEITDESIRIKANITDPYFIHFYNTLTEEEKQLIETSPAVVSEFIDPIEYNGFIIYNELITKLDHLSILLPKYDMSNGYWSKYINDYMVKDLNENELMQHNINKQIDGEIPMVTKSEASAKIDEEVKVEEIKEEVVNVSEEVTKEELQEAIQDIEKHEEVVEEVKEAIEDKLKEKEELSVVAEEIKEKVEEIAPAELKVEDVVIDEESEDIIQEEYETESDAEREVIVKMVSNLIDSVDGFRKPYFKERVKASVYLKKALSLNKEFIDSKYHSVIDSIDETSIVFGKELLSSIKKPTESKSIGKEYTQVSNNTYIKKFI